MRQPWRAWGVKQLLLFVLETLVLVPLILPIAGSDEVPVVMQMGARVLGPVILLVGFLIVLGWVQGRRTRHRPTDERPELPR
jgi:hypothetical protein